ncbi:MAG: hypothetical protein EXR62_02530 [Chloroflexi bacterium]|nr:hypothetical protein [Chloroflexota bacterium]
MPVLTFPTIEDHIATAYADLEAAWEAWHAALHTPHPQAGGLARHDVMCALRARCAASPGDSEAAALLARLEAQVRPLEERYGVLNRAYMALCDAGEAADKSG